MLQHLHTLSDEIHRILVTKKRSFCLDMLPFEHLEVLWWLRRARQATPECANVQ